MIYVLYKYIQYGEEWIGLSALCYGRVKKIYIILGHKDGIKNILCAEALGKTTEQNYQHISNIQKE